MALAWAVISCLASGYLIVALGWPREPKLPDEQLLRASLSIGLGIGVFSVIYFLVHACRLSHVLAIDLVVLALLVAAFLTLRRSASTPAASEILASESIALPRWLHRVLSGSFLFALIVAFYSAVVRSIAHPDGEGWDAFAIWNLHARYLFRGGEHWRDGFSPLIPWSHPDYPLLLPSAVAHFWSLLGHETTAVPTVIGLAFTFSTIGLLFSSLAILRGRSSAMLGGLALASTPFFVEQGSAQYADVPLSFFFLAVIVLLHLNDAYLAENLRVPGLVVLAGIAAGFAIWTKNEGMLFLCACVITQIIGRSRQSTRHVATLLAAVAPFLLLVVWFKHSVAFSNEIFSNRPAMLPKILDPSRYWVIVKWFAKDFLRFGEWWLVPGSVLLVLFYSLIADKPSKQSDPTLRASVWTLGLTLAGYFAIYVITTYDLYWHLRFSLNRLFLQLWPCVILLFFLAIPLESGKKVPN